MTRTFESKPAVRERVPLLVGLMGPSGGGKTYSALRLATGIASVAGGPIYLIDTEARRSLHYAGDFNFHFVPFGAPFGSVDYLAAIEHCVAKGAGTIIVDSMSHEHEGQGGMLEMHESEAMRLAKAWKIPVEKAKMSAWAKPKQDRRRLINTILQIPVNFIFCFRAKKKLKIVRGKDPQPMGYMPIAGEEFVFEMGVNCLLMPGAGGVPTWQTDEPGEREMIKLPGWARSFMATGNPLDEDIGAKLAQWAAGTTVRSAAELIEAFATCGDPATLGSLKGEARAAWKGASRAEREQLTAAMETATERVRAATADPEPESDASEPEDEAIEAAS